MTFGIAEPAGVCVVGSVNLDMVAHAQRLPRPGETVLGDDFSVHAGGKGLNQAIAAHRAGAATTLCAAVGADQAGVDMRALLREAGLSDAQVVQADQRPTGRALITVSDTGENAIVVVAGANAMLTAADATRAVETAAVVLAQLEVPIDTVLAAMTAARAAGARTILNPAPATELPAQLVAQCDYVIPNEHEAHALGGAERLLELGAGTVIVTAGAAGAHVVSRVGPSFTVPPFAVHARDTTAAGDAFCGAFAAALADGRTLAAALRFASAAGALATTVAGAVPSLPTRGQIEGLVAGRIG